MCRLNKYARNVLLCFTVLGMVLMNDMNVHASWASTNIPDPYLRTKIFQVMDPSYGYSTPDDIQQAHMQAATVSSDPALINLDISGLGITNIKGLEYITELNTLNMNNNNITSIEPLKSLTKLTQIDMDNNNISDLSYLNTPSYQASLIRLSANNNNISTIAPLASLGNLNALGLSNNRITNIPVFTYPNSISYLDLSDNNITTTNDFMNVQVLGNLTYLDFSRNYVSNSNKANNINDFSYLRPLTKLQIFKMEGYKGNDNVTEQIFYDLADGVNQLNMQEIYMADNDISDMTDINKFPNLTYLDVTNNKFIHDISNVASLTSLITLKASQNFISDTTPLHSLGSLTTLELDYNMIETAAPGAPPFVSTAVNSALQKYIFLDACSNGTTNFIHKQVANGETQAFTLRYSYIDPYTPRTEYAYAMGNTSPYKVLADNVASLNISATSLNVSGSMRTMTQGGQTRVEAAVTSSESGAFNVTIGVGANATGSYAAPAYRFNDPSHSYHSIEIHDSSNNVINNTTFYVNTDASGNFTPNPVSLTAVLKDSSGAVITPSNLKQKWTVSDITKVGFASLDDDNPVLLTPLSAGSATVSLTFNCGWAGPDTESVSTVIRMDDPNVATGIQITTYSTPLDFMSSGQFIATTTPGFIGPNDGVRWTSSDPTVLSIDTNPVNKDRGDYQTYQKAGTVRVTASSGSNNVSHSVWVTVADQNPVTGLNLSYAGFTPVNNIIEANVMDTGTVTGYILPNPGAEATHTIKWTSSNPTAVSLSVNETVDGAAVTWTGNAAGISTITAKSGDIEESFKVIIYNISPDPVSDVEITGDRTVITYVYRTGTARVNITPESAASSNVVVWTSSNPSVLHIDDYGRWTAVSPGVSYVTARVNGVTDTVEYIVKEPVTSISIDQPSFSTNTGTSGQLTATVTPSQALGPAQHQNQIEWSSSDTSVVTIDQNGNWNALTYGRVTIKAVCGDKADSITLTVTMDTTEIQNLQIDSYDFTTQVNTTGQLTATITPSSAASANPVTWSSGNTGVLSIDAAGNWTALAVGDSIVTATAGSMTASIKVTVVEEDIDPTDPNKVLNVSINSDSFSTKITTSGKLTATVSPTTAAAANPVSWSSSNNTIVSIDANGNWNALKIGSAVITATAGGVSDYITISVVTDTDETPSTKDATLRDLRVNGTTLSNFYRYSFDYTYRLGRDMTIKDVTVAATVYTSGASYVVNYPTSAPGTCEIVVTSPDATVTQTYTIYFTYSSSEEEDYGTYTYIESRQDFYDVLNLDTIVVEEDYRNTISDSYIRIEAPAGFEWEQDARVTGSGGLRSVRESTVRYRGGNTSSRDKQILQISLKNLEDTRDRKGNLYINDLVLIPTDSAPYGSVRVRVSGAGIDSASIIVGEYIKIDPALENGYTLSVPQAPNRVMITVGVKDVLAKDSIKKISQEPYLKNGRLMVPLADCASIFGYTTSGMNTSSNSATIYYMGSTVHFNSSQMTVNGNTKTMDTPVEVVNGTLFIPAKYLGEAIGFKVVWDSMNETAIFNSSN